MSRTRDEAKRFKERAEKHAGARGGCEHPVHSYSWTTNEHGFTIAKRPGSDHVIVDYDSVDPEPRHECTDTVLPPVFVNGVEFPANCVHARSCNDGLCPGCDDGGVKVLRWYRLPPERQQRVTPESCARCAGLVASMGAEGRQRYHDSGHQR